MKKATAYQVTATIDGKTWETKRTTLTAANEVAAIEKAKNALSLKPEHVTTVERITVYGVDAKLTTEDYPYRRQRTNAWFSVEMNKKGCRTVFQTENPKTGRINKEKKGTYYHVILPIMKDNGHFDFCGFLSFNGGEELNKGLQFMEDFKEMFSTEQLKSIGITIVAMMKVHAKAMVIYAGVNWEDVKPFIEAQVQAAVQIAQGKHANFLDCIIDNDKIKALKDPNFQPFKVTSY